MRISSNVLSLWKCSEKRNMHTVVLCVPARLQDKVRLATACKPLTHRYVSSASKRLRDFGPTWLQFGSISGPRKPKTTNRSSPGSQNDSKCHFWAPQNTYIFASDAAQNKKLFLSPKTLQNSNAGHCFQHALISVGNPISGIL